MNSINLDDYLTDLGISQEDEASPTAHQAQSAKRVTLPAPRPASPQSTFEQFMQGLVSRLGGDYQVKVQTVLSDGQEILSAEIMGEKAAKLPGRDGEVLHAMEVLAYTTLTRQFGPSDLKIRIDAGGYRQRQANTLASLAQRLAAQVAKTGEAHELQPMNASERRVIHMSLKDHPLVSTESRGEGKGRHLIILPK